MATLTDVLQAIEAITSDDWCGELSMSDANRKLRGRLAIAHEKLSKVYRLAHAFNKRHSCHHVHGNWRKELAERTPESRDK